MELDTTSEFDSLDSLVSDDSESQQVETPGGGNITAPPGSLLPDDYKPDARGRAWCFVVNNPEEVLEDFERYVKLECEKYTYQLERGEKKGTLHIQAALYFKSQRTWGALVKRWPTAYIRKAKNWKDLEKYSRKVATRESEVKTNIRKVKDPMEGLTPYGWQAALIDEISGEPDARKIIWYHEPNGRAGKTTLAKSLCLRYPGEIMYVAGAGADVRYGVKKWLDDNEGNLKCVIFGFPRSMEQKISYEALEQVKDGIFYNTKFESGMAMFDPPHVVVFSNWAPDKSKLSKDRWDIREIDIDGHQVTQIDVEEFM